VTEYTLKRSSRKSISLEVLHDLTVLVRAPKRMPKKRIDSFVAEHEGWIKSAQERQKARNIYEPDEAEKEELRQKAKAYLPGRLAFFEEQMGLKATGMKVTSAKKRLGSCSGQNRICFSLYLMLYPPEVIDYVVVHELAHIPHKNHGREFYALIGKYLPDYKERIVLMKKGYMKK